MRHPLRLAATLLALALPTAFAPALAGCGGGSGKLTVFAASSLQQPLTEYGESLDAPVRSSFAGSDELAAQIRQGALPDVYAAADTKYPWQLYREGLVERPRLFAANRLTIAVPTGGRVSSLADLERPGASIVVGDPSVPVGAYTREVLGRLPDGARQAILANVASEEPEVASVVAKLLHGGADAGFVYVTDLKTAPPGTLRAVAVPARLQPDVAYAAAVVKGTPREGAARRYLEGMLSGRGAADLRRAGFLPPP